MLPKKHRISRELFARLRNPKRAGGKFFLASVFALRDGHSKAACVVSRRISGSAVERNRIRRRVYAALRHILPRAKKPVAIVVYPKREIADASHEDIQRDITAALLKEFSA